MRKSSIASILHRVALALSIGPLSALADPIVPFTGATPAAPASALTPSLLSAYSGDSSSLLTASGQDELEPTPTLSLSTYARTGWQATLSTLAHGVRGTVTIVDEDTFRVDNFFYDGGGINVHFILAAANDYATFRDARLVTERNFLTSPRTPFTGGSVIVDLPSGTTFDGYQAISLWCLPAGANFGSGTFAPPANPPLPEPTSALLLGTGALALAIRRRRR